MSWRMNLVVFLLGFLIFVVMSGMRVGFLRGFVFVVEVNDAIVKGWHVVCSFSK